MRTRRTRRRGRPRRRVTDRVPLGVPSTSASTRKSSKFPAGLLTLPPRCAAQNGALPPHRRRPERRLPLGPARARDPREIRSGTLEAVQPCGGVYEAHEVDGRQVESGRVPRRSRLDPGTDRMIPPLRNERFAACRPTRGSGLCTPSASSARPFACVHHRSRWLDSALKYSREADPSRPRAAQAIASGLTDLDLVFIEEAFERLLLDYDRVFSSMGIPSCLWRRTGEIYKGNKEFAALGEWSRRFFLSRAGSEAD